MQPSPMTLREFLLLPEDGRRRELVDGELSVPPSPTTTHQKVSRFLQYQLMTQLELPGLAQVMNAPVDVIFDDLNVVVPDLVIVSTARAAIVKVRAVEGAPDELVEIVSPSSVDRDRKLKFDLYAHFGVREYWIVDPTRCVVDAYRLLAGGYQLRAQYGANAALSCPDFPSLAIDPAAVFTP